MEAKMITVKFPAKGLVYETYMKQFRKLVEEGKTSGADQSAKMIEYTKLNLHRSEKWNKIGKINDELKAVLRAIPEKQIWYVLSEFWCGDASQLLPFLAKMVEENPEKLSLNILLRDEHPEIMNAYLTNEAKAIPKLIALDGSGNEIFNWGPRPKEIQEFFIAEKKKGIIPSDELKTLIHKKYAEDKGESLQQEIKTILKSL